jgi:putative aldouronate transport system permease protein
MNLALCQKVGKGHEQMIEMTLKPKRRKRFARLKRELPLHLYLLPGVILVILFCYMPMMGLIISFQNFRVFKGWFAAQWVGLDNFKYILSLPNFTGVLFNTVYISSIKIVCSLVVPIAVALLLNEMTAARYKRTLQSVMYLPYFMSWIILGGIIKDLLGTDGLINSLITSLGAQPVNFLTSNQNFRSVLVVSDVWKTFGFNTIVYMAALTSIDPTLYEAARMDGANRWQQTMYVTIPGMMPIIVMLATLSLGNILNAGFEQVLVMYNKLVLETGDIIDTFVYRLAFEQAKYSVSAGVGLFKSLVSLLLISTSYYMAYRFADYRIF